MKDIDRIKAYHRKLSDKLVHLHPKLTDFESGVCRRFGKSSRVAVKVYNGPFKCVSFDFWRILNWFDVRLCEEVPEPNPLNVNEYYLGRGWDNRASSMWDRPDPSTMKKNYRLNKVEQDRISVFYTDYMETMRIIKETDEYKTGMTLRSLCAKAEKRFVDACMMLTSLYQEPKPDSPDSPEPEPNVSTRAYIQRYKNDPTMEQVGSDFESDDEYKVLVTRSGNKWRKLKVKRE